MGPIRLQLFQEPGPARDRTQTEDPAQVVDKDRAIPQGSTFLKALLQTRQRLQAVDRARIIEPKTKTYTAQCLGNAPKDLDLDARRPMSSDGPDRPGPIAQDNVTRYHP